MNFTCSNKKTVQWLVQGLLQVGVEHIVISPGSRNAPLIISFANCPQFTCYNIVDERSAAFYAMGMAKQLNKPVAIVCTSGSAVLNYAPAISEAFYQEIPLIVITADRPKELIDQEDGQTIHQQDIYANYIKNAISLPTCNKLDNEFEIEKHLHQCLANSNEIPFGPIHINIPFNEPLYETVDIELQIKNKLHSAETKNFQLNDYQIKTFAESEKVMVIVGVMPPNKTIEKQLNILSKNSNLTILASPISNINPSLSCSTESVVYNNKPEELASLAPDLLITIGGPVVSKALKQFIRNNKPKHHWDIDINPKTIDTYQCLSDKLIVEPEIALKQLSKLEGHNQSNYKQLWQERKAKISAKRTNYENSIVWNDFKAYSLFLKNTKQAIDLHLANSTPVRYAELFDKHPLINYYSNRGTSGIDGSTSTAAGGAIISGNETYLITGDLSFLYDSNALWNNHLPHNLKIIVINNQGGNIFKIIKGPNGSDQIDHFQAHTPTNIEALCKAYGVNYLSAKDTKSFELALNQLQMNNVCTILEAKTDAELGAESYRNYFKYLMQ